MCANEIISFNVSSMNDVLITVKVSCRVIFGEDDKFISKKFSNYNFRQYNRTNFVWYFVMDTIMSYFHLENNSTTEM